ncbi:MAG: hypothetical protein H7A36_06440 [Chlamydiales bacterium]|nr:hypothetical protein [Chlamydiales bacterium]
MPAVDRIATCCYRKWERTDYILCAKITLTAIASITLLTLGFLKWQRRLHLDLNAKALIGCGLALPLMVYVVLQWGKELATCKCKKKEALTPSLQKTKRDLGQHKAHTPYRDSERRGHFFTTTGREKVPFYRIRVHCDEPFYGKLHAGDQFIVEKKSSLEDFHFFVVRFRSDPEAPYTLDILKDEDIDAFKTIVQSTEYTTSKELANKLDEIGIN